MKSLYHLFLAWLGSVIYRHPSKKIILIGITGTKGKSSSIEILNAILEAAGKKTALLSSIRVKVGEVSEKNRTDTTMPGRFYIQKFLRRAVQNKCTHAILEVTSQGVLQSRHRFLDFNVAAFLNLHPEHVEAHGSFESYRAAKVGFFRAVAQTRSAKQKIFVVNGVDDASSFFIAAVGQSGKIVQFTVADFIARILKGDKSFLGDWFQNEFNLEDAAFAAILAEALGIQSSFIVRALSYFPGIPGRMEWVQKTPFGLVVDYAHTPDSLRAVYKTLREQFKKSSEAEPDNKTPDSLPPFPISSPRLICVLGSAGGGRDTWKRPEFGRIAAEYCDEIIITDEDPYNEDPEKIMDEIESGISLNPKPSTLNPNFVLKRSVNRQKAIEIAIKDATIGDVIVITGKGSEEWLHQAHGKKLPWSDRRTAEEALKNEEK